MSGERPRLGKAPDKADHAPEIVASVSSSLVSKEPLLDSKKGWRGGAYTGLCRFGYVAVPVVLFNLISYFELISFGRSSSFAMIIAVVLFLLALPCSALLKLDQWVGLSAMGGRHEVSLLIALSMVLLNFVLIGAFVGWTRGRTEPCSKDEDVHPRIVRGKKDESS